MTQDDAMSIFIGGANIFLTGSPGTGKTFLVEKIKEHCRKQGRTVAVTASTGIAATHIGGKTIHSWSGIHIYPEHFWTDEAKFREIVDKSFFVAEEISGTDVLIIDEISMLHAFQLDAVDKMCRYFRYNDKPFGGIQVVLSGDFFQLPPVAEKKSESKYAFEADVWNKMNLNVCYLDKVYRQSDMDFIHSLNEIRAGRVTPDIITYFMQRVNKVVTLPNGILPVKFFGTNRQVDTLNNQELASLHTTMKFYEMEKHGYDERLIKILVDNCLSPERLTLKIGAAVMFTKNNFELGYVNGTLGKVIDFNYDGFPIVMTANGRHIIVSPEKWKIQRSFVEKKMRRGDDESYAEIIQIPLRLAWAITIHKSQGMSLDGAEMNLKNMFMPGMGYVAISRVRSLEGINILDMDSGAFRVDPHIIEKDRIFRICDEDTRIRNQSLFVEAITKGGEI